MAKTTSKPAQDARRDALARSSKAQHAENPQILLRVPRSLYRALRAAARADNRQFPDWMRVNLPKLLPSPAEPINPS